MDGQLFPFRLGVTLPMRFLPLTFRIAMNCYAQIMVFSENDDEICEGCFARKAVGTFNVDDVETPLCPHCSVYRNEDNTRVVLPGFPV